MRTMIPLALGMSLVSSALLGQAPAGRVSLELGRPVVTIGSESDEGPEIFGHVLSAALDPGGRVYVLDGSDNSVRIFERDGRFVSSIGRKGRGPGDFTNPWGVIHDGRDGLFVPDDRLGLTMFRTTASGATLVRVMGAAQRPRAVCSLGDSLVLGGEVDEQLVHVLARSGDRARSYGGPFSVDTVPAIREMESGQPVVLACDPGSGRVVVAQARGEKVRAYDRDGRLEWQMSLPDYVGMFYGRDARTGGAMMGIHDHVTQGMHLLSPDVVLLQVLKLVRVPADVARGRRGRFANGTLTSHFIDAKSGRLLSTTTSLPVIHTVRGALVVEGRTDPFPQVSVRPFTLRR